VHHLPTVKALPCDVSACSRGACGVRKYTGAGYRQESWTATRRACRTAASASSVVVVHEAIVDCKAEGAGRLHQRAARVLHAGSVEGALRRKRVLARCVRRWRQRLLRSFSTKLEQGGDVAAEEVGWTTADPSRYPQQVCRGLARLLSHGKVTSEGARWLARQIGGRLPPGWGAVWMERGCSELEGTLTAQPQQMMNYLRAMEIWCVLCQV
jgi:hypothetical protein